MAVEEMTNQLSNICVQVEIFLQNVCGRKLYNDIKSFACRHPFIFLAIGSICAFSSLPFLFFLGFAIITLFIALLCFLCIEGSIIAVGGLIFVGVVSFISVIVIAFIAASAAAYWVIQKIKFILLCRRYHMSRLYLEPSAANTTPGETEKVD